MSKFYQTADYHWPVFLLKIHLRSAQEPPLPYRTFFYGENSSLAHGRALSQTLLEECQEIVQEARDLEALLAGDETWQGEKLAISKGKGRAVRRASSCY